MPRRRRTCGRSGTPSAARRWCCAAPAPTCCRRPPRRQMTARGPKPRLVEFPGVGHAPMLLSPDQVAPVVAFLREVTLDRAVQAGTVRASRGRLAAASRLQSSATLAAPSCSCHVARPLAPCRRPPSRQPARNPAGEGRAVARRDAASKDAGRGGAPHRRRAGGHQPDGDERRASASTSPRSTGRPPPRCGRSSSGSSRARRIR